MEDTPAPAGACSPGTPTPPPGPLHTESARARLRLGRRALPADRSRHPVSPRPQEAGGPSPQWARGRWRPREGKQIGQGHMAEGGRETQAAGPPRPLSPPPRSFRRCVSLDPAAGFQVVRHSSSCPCLAPVRTGDSARFQSKETGMRAQAWRSDRCGVTSRLPAHSG